MFQGITPNPDRAFIKKLKRIDPGLDCTFDRKVGKFVITQKGKISGTVPLFVVEGNEGGGYRYPDNRDIMSIHAADTHRAGRTFRDRARTGEDAMLAYNSRMTAKAREEIRDATKDDKLQLMKTYHKAMGLQGKGPASYFNRVQPKPKKDTYVARDKRLVKT